MTVTVPDKPSVALVGCWGPGLLAAEQYFLDQCRINPSSNTVIDLSPLPVLQVQTSGPEIDIYQTDAALFDFSVIRPDLFITDLFFDTPDVPSHTIFEHLISSLSPKGHLLTRVCLIPDRTLDVYSKLLNLAGQFWGLTARQLFGADQTSGRDLYYGLTPSQWSHLGQLFAYFIQTNFYHPNRFKTIDEARRFFTATGTAVIESENIIFEYLNPEPISIVSFCLKPQV